MTEEEKRIDEARRKVANWRRWGPYLSDRQWGTVREDYSPDGEAWDYLPHDQARSRAYRWGEDGLAGISDKDLLLCFAISLWNGNDPILKERLFGLSNNEGNHGEDVKEYYFYLDNTPTHSYMKFLYKYPQTEFPYEKLIANNQIRSLQEGEYELLDTGVFKNNRYFDVLVEYVKASPEDILVRVEVTNRGPEEALIHVLPSLWFRNTWSWQEGSSIPSIKLLPPKGDVVTIEATHHRSGKYWLYYQDPLEVIFTNNETNNERLYKKENPTPYVKDAFHEYLVDGVSAAVNPKQVGTKAAAHYQIPLEAGQQKSILLRLSKDPDLAEPFGTVFQEIFQQRRDEADQFYERISPFSLNDELNSIQRQAFAGLLWTKQSYHYDIRDWLKGDPADPPPPDDRKYGRNRHWIHFNSRDILSMPDKWEYPWFAAWDLAFHTIPLVMVDPDFAKDQLLLLTREWFMHPNGQLPAYEWNFGDVNPPVHAWAAYRIYKIEEKMYGVSDRDFLERIFQKLLLNFTWWVNRKDLEGNNIFEGGFLGLDNIGVFDRSSPVPTGGFLEQADATSWMGMYCLNMLSIALELARTKPIYEDIATKFFEHFVYIAHAINGGQDGTGLWDEEDGFYFDKIRLPGGQQVPLKQFTMAGLIPLFAVATGDLNLIEEFPDFRRRARWFVRNRPELVQDYVTEIEGEPADRLLLSLVTTERLRRILERVLNEDDLLSPFGIRSLSRRHAVQPFVFETGGLEYRLDYEPGESQSGLFGGNSNWRGPIWFPLNYLLIESLQKYHYYLGDEFTVEFPTGSGRELNLWEVAGELSRRLISIFQKDQFGRIPYLGKSDDRWTEMHWNNLNLYYEYFHGETGQGLGASHQTGWTALVAKLIQQQAKYDAGHGEISS